MKAERNIYRRVYQRLWRHANFRGLSADEKVLALYLVTGPQTNLIGWYRFSPALAAEDINVPISQIRKRLTTVLAAFEWEFDDATQLLWIRSWHRWNPPNGVHSRTAWRREIERMPSGKPKRWLLDAIDENRILRDQGAVEQEELVPGA